MAQERGMDEMFDFGPEQRARFREEMIATIGQEEYDRAIAAIAEKLPAKLPAESPTPDEAEAWVNAMVEQDARGGDLFAWIDANSHVVESRTP